MEEINWEDFSKVCICAGTVLEVVDFPEAIKPAFKLRVDFGASGVKWTSAQVKANYTESDLLGKQVLGVINFPIKRIAGFKSEFLLTGFEDKAGNIVLASVDGSVPNGYRLK